MKQVGVAVILLWVLANPALGETTAIFTLDGFSSISFGDEEVVSLPAGSTIQFHFGSAAKDGSIPFRIEPDDVRIADVPLRSGGILRYALVSGASGTMTPTESGRRIDFTATVRATLRAEGANDGSQEYSMRFTTEAVEATDASGARTLQINGMRLMDGAWYGQLVGATTNKKAAWPEPGAAVVTVLSGRFDRVP